MSAIYRRACTGLVVCALAVCVFLAAALPASAETSETNDKKLSGNDYYMMAPFTIPMVNGGEFDVSFTIVVALELKSDEVRPDVSHLDPKLRDAMYKELFRLITFRTLKPRLPRLARIKQRLMLATDQVTNGFYVNDIVVQQAHMTKR